MERDLVTVTETVAVIEAEDESEFVAEPVREIVWEDVVQTEGESVPEEDALPETLGVSEAEKVGEREPELQPEAGADEEAKLEGDTLPVTECDKVSLEDDEIVSVLDTLLDTLCDPDAERLRETDPVLQPEPDADGDSDGDGETLTE